MLNEKQVLESLRNVADLPQIRNKGRIRDGWGVLRGTYRDGRRTIYEIAGPAGHFYIDYPTYPGGTTDEVPRIVIEKLERTGLIERAYPEAPQENAWALVNGR